MERIRRFFRKWHKHKWEFDQVPDKTKRLPDGTLKQCKICGEQWSFQRTPSLFEKGGVGVEHGDIWWKITGKNSLGWGHQTFIKA